jgi:curved DNA-binding protein CbpA
MRKYHPDNYGTDPTKAALATELTQKLSQAYRELEGILRGTAARKRM